MAKGELNQQVKVGGIKELETLANSFNWMAGQLKESFDTLEEKVKKQICDESEAVDFFMG